MDVNRLSLYILLALPLLSYAGCVTAPQLQGRPPSGESVVDAADRTADAEAIRELSRRWDAAMRARDVEQLLGLYAPDAVIYEPGLSPITGADALRQHFTELAALDVRTMNSETREVEVAASGDWAFETGYSLWEWVEPHGRVVERGPYLVVWKKGDDGWRISREIFNSDQPLPPRTPEPE